MPRPVDATIGQRLARARRRAGLSQARLAADAGCSGSYVSKVERGEIALNDLALARRLAEVVSVSLIELLRLDQERPAAGYDAQPPRLRVEEMLDGVDRRAWLIAAGRLAGGLAGWTLLGQFDPDERDVLMAALADPGRNLGERVVRLVERVDAHAQRRTSPLPIDQRLAHAQEHLAVVLRLRPAARSRAHQQRLAVVEVQASRLLGRLVGYWRGPRRTRSARHAAPTTAPISARQQAPGRTSLLPPRLEQLHGAVPVVDAIEVPGLGAPVAGLDELRAVRHIWRRAGVLACIGLDADESYVLADKRFPHALHELMVLSAGPTVRPGLHHHSPAFGAALGALAVCFATHCHDRGLYPVVSWSYDPDTCDRASIQGEKRFHAHLIGRTPDEMATLARPLALPATWPHSAAAGSLTRRPCSPRFWSPTPFEGGSCAPWS